MSRSAATNFEFDMYQPFWSSLSFSTDNMDVEDLKTQSKSHDIYSINPDDLSDVEDMDVEHDELADIWPLPFNPS